MIVNSLSSISETFSDLFSQKPMIKAKTSDIDSDELENFLERVYNKLKKSKKSLNVNEVYEVPVSIEHGHGSTLVNLEFKVEENGLSFCNKEKQLDKISNKIILDLFKS